MPKPRISIPVVNGYAICPKCRVNQKAMQILPDTVIRNGVLWCRVCKRSILVDVVDGRCYVSGGQKHV